MNNSKSVGVPKKFVPVVMYAEERFQKNFSTVVWSLLADYVHDDMVKEGLIK